MQRTALLIVVAMMAMCFADDYDYQSNWNTQIMTSGAIYNGTLFPTFNDRTSFHVDVYAIWVPETASAVYTTFENTNSDECYYIYRRLLTGDIPCSPGEYQYQESNTDFPCILADDPSEGYSGVYTEDFIAGDYFEGRSTWRVNTYWYFAIGRYYGSDSNNTCSYTLQATVNNTCPAGTTGVSVGLNLGTPTCTDGNITAVTVPFQSATLTAVAYTQHAYKIPVVLGTGNIHVIVNVTDTYGLYFYGKAGGAPSDYSSSYDCYSGSYSYTNTSGDITYYIYDFYCEVPRAGDYYLVNEAVSGDYNYTISITTEVCPAGFGGYMCGYPVFNASDLLQNGTSSATYTVPFATGQGLNDYTYAYMFMDIPVNFTGDYVRITVTPTTASAATYVQLRKDGFTEYYSQYYDLETSPSANTASTFGFGAFEYATGGRWYLGMSCGSAPGCAFTVSFNTTENNSGGNTDDGTSAGVTSTTGTTGAAGIILPSVALLAAILSALL